MRRRFRRPDARDHSLKGSVNVGGKFPFGVHKLSLDVRPHRREIVPHHARFSFDERLHVEDHSRNPAHYFCSLVNLNVMGSFSAGCDIFSSQAAIPASIICMTASALRCTTASIFCVACVISVSPACFARSMASSMVCCDSTSS